MRFTCGSGCESGSVAEISSGSNRFNRAICEQEHIEKAQVLRGSKGDRPQGCDKKRLHRENAYCLKTDCEIRCRTSGRGPSRLGIRPAEGLEVGSTGEDQIEHAAEKKNSINRRMASLSLFCRPKVSMSPSVVSAMKASLRFMAGPANATIARPFRPNGTVMIVGIMPWRSQSRRTYQDTPPVHQWIPRHVSGVTWCRVTLGSAARHGRVHAR